jgi:hypothetical protein
MELLACRVILRLDLAQCGVSCMNVAFRWDILPGLRVAGSYMALKVGRFVDVTEVG